jgi:hypothetical protein
VFDTTLGNMGFVVGEVALGEVSLQFYPHTTCLNIKYLAILILKHLAFYPQIIKQGIP